ncbi:MAG: 4'-phosphopantetheinyl transferase superfamily protein [Desulfuromusa sp.]|nr:4'-phosphopantetheinyl transferase superfamily protein [Desulfuromusa sp.]
MKKDSGVYSVGCNKGVDVVSDLTLWQLPPQTLILRAGELHLWRFELDCSTEKSRSQQRILSADELVRAERLLDPQKKQYFISARSHLRQLLGIYLKLSPELICFNYNENGKPFLSAPKEAVLSFNLSHSGSRAIVAVVADSDVGIDIEKIEPALDFHQLASRYFDLTEKKQLTNFSEVRQRRGFYRLWTRKEAGLKMLGSGFSGHNREERLATTSNRGYLQSPFLASGYVAAVATNTEITSISRFNFPIE